MPKYDNFEYMCNSISTYKLLHFFLNSFYRAMLCIRDSAVLAMGLCPSVCVRVCLSQAGVLLKRQNVRITQTTPHDTPRESSFLMPKISAKFDRITPYDGAECRWGGSKSATFDK